MALIFCVVLFLARMSKADGGAIQFQGDAGPFHVTVFTLPPILSAGPVDVTVLVQDRSNLSPLLDANVTLDLTARGDRVLGKDAWSPPSCSVNKSASLTGYPDKTGSWRKPAPLWRTCANPQQRLVAAQDQHPAQ